MKDLSTSTSIAQTALEALDEWILLIDFLASELYTAPLFTQERAKKMDLKIARRSGAKETV